MEGGRLVVNTVLSLLAFIVVFDGVLASYDHVAHTLLYKKTWSKVA